MPTFGSTSSTFNISPPKMNPMTFPMNSNRPPSGRATVPTQPSALASG
jgi:hypothetical protein